MSRFQPLIDKLNQQDAELCHELRLIHLELHRQQELIGAKRSRIDQLMERIAKSDPVGVASRSGKDAGKYERKKQQATIARSREWCRQKGEWKLAKRKAKAAKVAFPPPSVEQPFVCVECDGYYYTEKQGFPTRELAEAFAKRHPDYSVWTVAELNEYYENH